MPERLTAKQRKAVGALVYEVRTMAEALSKSKDEDDNIMGGAWSSLALRAEQAHAAALEYIDYLEAELAAAEKKLRLVSCQYEAAVKAQARALTPSQETP